MKKRNRVLSIVLASALTFSALFSATGAMAIPDQSISSQLSLYDFTVEYVEQPQGVDVDSPRFGWKMDSNRIGAAQAAYQIVVKDADGVVAWDSGVWQATTASLWSTQGKKSWSQTQTIPIA